MPHHASRPRHACIAPCDAEAWGRRATRVEEELRRYVEAFRQEQHLACHWDEEGLGHLFLQSMWQQQERL